MQSDSEESLSEEELELLIKTNVVLKKKKNFLLLFFLQTSFTLFKFPNILKVFISTSFAFFI